MREEKKMDGLRRKRSRLLSYLSAVAFLISLAWSSIAAFSAEKQASSSSERLRVAFSSISGNTAPLWVAHEHGFFRKYGLDVELLFIEGGSTTVQTLISGDVALAQMAGSAVIQSRLRGADVVLIAGLINTLTFQVIVEKGISQPNLLKGKAIGVTRFGSSTDFAARYALDKWGLTPQREVMLMELGSMPALLSALTSGKIQGAMLSAPFTLHAKKSGFPALADLQMLGLEYQHTGIAATQKLIKSKPDLVRNFMKAYVEGIHFYKTHRQEALAVMAKYLKTNDMDALTETYETIGLTLLPEKPYPTLKGIQLMLAEFASKEPKARSARPEQFVDTSFIRELDASGFIGRLYKPLVSVASGEQSPPSAPSTKEQTAPLEDKKSPVAKSAAASQGQALQISTKPTELSPAKADVGQDYTIQAGDTLSKLSERFYQSQMKWPIIYEANRETIKNPHYIYIGQQIRIPPNGKQGA
jgi:NitT/TauT family transport system substrate-binding protein